ncbi:hypothetical protein JZU68_07870, partial [bacterium]|nr:hypothetical protein [bacterium]
TQIERGKFMEATAMSIGLILGLTIAYVSFKSDGSNSKESTLSARNLKRIENYEKTVKVGNTNLHVVHQRMGAAMLKSQLPGESTQHLMKRWAGTLTPADREEEQYYPYCH